MFNRSSYKQIAKKQLKGRWTTPVLAVLVISAIYFVLNLPDQISTIMNNGLSFPDLSEIFDTESNFFNENGHHGYNFSMKSNIPIETSSNLIIGIASYFIFGAIIQAFTGLFVKMFHTTDKVPFNAFISGFSQCISGFLGFLWYTLWTFLWSCLFVIPGIVKAFSYSQMFFVMADNPKIGCIQAMKISKVLTKGNKGDLFVMCLSFLGWDILCALTLGILGLWVTPYKMMSFTNAYYAMKAQALKAGSLTPEDFGEPSPNTLGGEN